MKTLITTILLLSITVSFSQTENFKKATNPEVIAQKLNAASKTTKTIDSDFKQYKHLDILENDMESSGHFSYSSPNKVRWEYLQPYKYLIVMNSGTMWINNGSKTKKYDTQSNKMFKEINDLMVGMLQGKILKSDKFNVSFDENNKQILANLTPKTPEMKEFISSMHLYFDKKDYLVKKIKMLELSGDYTLIKFYNRKINIEIPNSLFNVK